MPATQNPEHSILTIGGGTANIVLAYGRAWTVSGIASTLY